MATNNAANQKNTGIQSLTSGGAFNGVTITGTANQISVSNGDGTGGNPTLSLTSNIYVSGISFNSGTNILSTFTEGTWSPTITNSGSAPVVTYSSHPGRYSQIGNAINIEGRIQLSAYTAGTGNLQISALPFTPANVSNQSYVCQVGPQTLTFGASVTWYNLLISPNSTDTTLIGNKSATTVYTAAAGDITAAFIVVFTGWFSIA